MESNSFFDFIKIPKQLPRRYFEHLGDQDLVSHILKESTNSMLGVSTGLPWWNFEKQHLGKIVHFVNDIFFLPHPRRLGPKVVHTCRNNPWLAKWNSGLPINWATPSCWMTLTYTQLIFVSRREKCSILFYPIQFVNFLA